MARLLISFDKMKHRAEQFELPDMPEKKHKTPAPKVNPRDQEITDLKRQLKESLAELAELREEVKNKRWSGIGGYMID